MRSYAKQHLPWLAIPLAFALVVLLFFSFRYRIEFDTDEGVNTIKALMLLRGHRLYADIWSDQPPFFTYLLAGWLKVFGERLTAGRVMVLLFSASLVALAAGYLKKNWGMLAALSGGLTFALLPFYLQLSVSMMIGLPAIALAFASFYALTEWHSQPSRARLLVSAVLLGLSILTKGFTIILAPIWLIGIVLAVARDPRFRSQGSARWASPLLWLGTLALVGALAVVFVIGPGNLDQLLTVHLEASRSLDLEALPGRRTLESYLSETLPLFFMAVAGSWFAARQRKWSALYLAGWIVVGYGLLKATAPTWYHHQLLLTVPAAVLASIAVAGSVQALRSVRTRGLKPLGLALALISAALFLVFLAVRAPGTVEGLDFRLPNLQGLLPLEEDQERALLGSMGDHASEVRWLYTDRPIFAFITGLPVPPNLAVITQKRLLTGHLTEDEIAATLETYAPEMVLNARFGLPAVEEYMRTRNFTRIDETTKYRLYLRSPSP